MVVFYLPELDMNENWFQWYVEQVSKKKSWAMYRERFLCPCCFMPTLDERAIYDICPICFWEDDGQDSDDANIVRGGPNSDYSLEEARKNFERHRTMYRETDKLAFESEMKRISKINKMYEAFTKAIKSDSDADWLNALKIEGRG